MACIWFVVPMNKMRCVSLFLVLVSFWGCQREAIHPKKNLAFDRVALYGGSNEDIAHAVITTSDGGFAVLGNTKSADGDLGSKTTTVSDIVLMKFDVNGALQWTKTYGGSNDDRGHDLIQLPDEGYAVIGYAMSADGDLTNNEGMHDNWVFRLNGQGELLWQKSFGFSGHDHAYHILATPDGGFLFNGFLDVTSSQGQGSSAKGKSVSARHGVGEFWVHKIDRNGHLQWRRYYGGTNNDRSYAAVIDPAGGYYIVGTSESDDVDVTNARGSYDIWVVKINNQGDMLWEKSFGGTAFDAANAAVLKDNVLYILGNSFSADQDVSSPLGQSDFWLLAIDEQGKLLRENSFGGSGFDLGKDVLLDHRNQLWLVGYGQSVDGDFLANSGENDIQLLGLDHQLLPQMSATLGGEGQDLANALVEWQNKILVVGSTESRSGQFRNNQGDKDIFVALWDLQIE